MQTQEPGTLPYLLRSLTPARTRAHRRAFHPDADTSNPGIPDADMPPDAEIAPEDAGVVLADRPLTINEIMASNEGA